MTCISFKLEKTREMIQIRFAPTTSISGKNIKRILRDGSGRHGSKLMFFLAFFSNSFVPSVQGTRYKFGSLVSIVQAGSRSQKD